MLISARRCFFILAIVLTAGNSVFAQNESGTPASAAYERGLKSLRAGNSASAATYFRQAITFNPGLYDAYMGLAEARRASGDKAEDVIRDQYDKIVAKRPDHWKAYEAAGCACLEDKNWNCHKYFSEVIRIRPGYARGYTGFARGHLYGMPASNQKQLIREYVLPALRKATALDPKSGEAWYETGNAYRMLGLPDSAFVAYGKAIASQSGLALPYALRGDLNLQQQKAYSAYADYTRATLTDPTLVRAWTGRGTANLQLRDYPAAVDDYDKALALKSSDFSALVGRGTARRMQGRYAEAIADLSAADAVAIKDEYSIALKERSLAQQAAGNNDAAFEDIEKAFLRMSKWDSGYAENAYLYGQAYERRGRWSPAKDMYKKSLAVQETSTVRAAYERVTAADNASLAASRSAAQPASTGSSPSSNSYRSAPRTPRKMITERCGACDGSGKIYYEKLAVGGGLSSGGSTYYSTVNQYGTKTYGSSAGTGSVMCTRCKGKGTVTYQEDDYEDY
jgi:tetratricopeptide (TPR) repeat protein